MADKKKETKEKEVKEVKPNKKKAPAKKKPEPKLEPAKKESEKKEEKQKLMPTGELFAKNRVVIIDREINKETAQPILTQLIYLYNLSPELPITVYINSPGGSIPHGLSIISMMRMFKDVRTVCIGHACSMASIILAAGTPGLRWIHEDSDFVMMHQIRGGMWGKATELEIEHDMMKKTNEHLARMLSKYTKQPFDKIMADWKEDHWMTPQEAKDYGFVDDVIGDGLSLRPVYWDTDEEKDA